MELHVSPDGNDEWSGLLEVPNSAKTDGPLATIGGARDRIRTLRRPSRKDICVEQQVAMLEGPTTVWIHDGVYRISSPIHFGPEDSAPVAYKAAKGAKPVVDGGMRLKGWQAVTINGVKAWTLDLVKSGAWPLSDTRQLFVNGRRATRARLPKVGFYKIEDPLLEDGGSGWGKPAKRAFIARQGAFASWTNLHDVDVVAFHYWVDERLPVAGYDPETRTVRCAATPRSPLTLAWDRGDCPYFIENVVDGLSESGEWAYDGAAKRMWYVPREGEVLETSEVVVPQAVQLLQVVGDEKSGRTVDWLCFEGLTFRYAASVIPGEPDERPGVLGMDRNARIGNDGAWMASSSQAGIDQAGALYLRGTRGVSLVGCVVEHVGGYAVQIDGGCTEMRLCHNTLRDLGAGGISANGADAGGDPLSRTKLIRISDNHIHDGGHIVHAGIGILVRHVSEAVVVHNEVHDFYYTAISMGWIWGYKDSIAANNIIAFNHLHDIGKGWLSDMGGIYTLGPQPGTVIRNNLIHDIESAAYGGWAIYPDEGTSHVVIEDNVAYRTDRSVFHQHYGRENTVRNNIFAFGGEGIVAISKREAHLSATFTGNIFLSDKGYIYSGGYAMKLGDPGTLSADLNIVWDINQGEPLAGASRKTTEAAVDVENSGIAWSRWVASGFDRHSIVADPCFVDPLAGDFRLRPESPALAMGFNPIDLSTVGPQQF